MTRSIAAAFVAAMTMIAFAGPLRAEWAVASGGSVRVGFYYALEPDCRSVGEASVNVLQAPSSGSIETKQARDYPNFPTTNVRSHCDTRRVPVTEVIYHAAPGYVGWDQVVFEVVFPRGQARRYRAVISVR